MSNEILADLLATFDEAIRSLSNLLRGIRLLLVVVIVLLVLAILYRLFAPRDPVTRRR